MDGYGPIPCKSWISGWVTRLEFQGIDLFRCYVEPNLELCFRSQGTSSNVVIIDGICFLFFLSYYLVCHSSVHSLTLLFTFMWCGNLYTTPCFSSDLLQDFASPLSTSLCSVPLSEYLSWEVFLYIFEVFFIQVSTVPSWSTVLHHIFALVYPQVGAPWQSGVIGEFTVSLLLCSESANCSFFSYIFFTLSLRSLLSFIPSL